MGHHRNRYVLVLNTGTSIAVDGAKVTAKLDRGPARFDQRPAQPFVALPEQTPMEDASATRVRRRHYPSVSRQFRGAVEALDPVDLRRDYAAKEWTNPRNALQQPFLVRVLSLYPNLAPPLALSCYLSHGSGSRKRQVVKAH